MSCASIAAVLEALAETGATPQMMAAAARKMADQEDSRRAEVREQARVRKQRQRIRERAETKQPDEIVEDASRVTCVTERDACDVDTPAPLFPPLLPSPQSLTNNPPIIPPSSENLARENAKKPDPKGSRLPPDWELPDDWLADARAIAFKAKQPINEQEIPSEADKFRDFWTAKPGAAGRKLDWRGTWRNWFRSYLERRPKPRNAPGTHGPAAFSEHGRSTVADVVLRRRLLRENGNGVPDDAGRGHDVPAEADVIDGEYRRVG